MQEVRDMGRKEEGDEVGLPGLWIGMIVDGFQVEGKDCEDQERLKRCSRKSSAT